MEDEAQAEEGSPRPSFAERLHDGPVQELTAAQLFIETAIMELREDGMEVAPDSLLQRGADSLYDALASVRAVMRDLARVEGRDA